jgi:inhibitor of cysteine peptidase
MGQVEVGTLGGRVHVKVGDEVLVRLPENPSTGYRWELDPPQGSLELADDAYVRSRDGAVGSGGERHFTLRAKRIGQAEIQLRLARSWEQHAIKQGSVAITIEP